MVVSLLDLQSNISYLLEQIGDNQSVEVYFNFDGTFTLVYFNIGVITEGWERDWDLVSVISFKELKYKLDNIEGLGILDYKSFNPSHNLNSHTSYFYECLVNSNNVRYMKEYEEKLYNWVKFAIKYFCLEYNYSYVDFTIVSSLSVKYNYNNPPHVEALIR